MKYDHVVKFRGRYYAAGENVPMEKETVEVQAQGSDTMDKTESNVEENVASPKRGRPSKK